MIRIVIVDDHPAVRIGLKTALEAEPGIVPVGSADSAEQLWPLLYSTKPDVVLLDYHLPGTDGLQICRRVKAEALAPKVVLYSAYAGGALAIPAALAGADRVVGKGIPARELFEVIRETYGGLRALPPIPREHFADASAKLPDEDLPILGMLLDQTPHPEVADVLGIDAPELESRIDRMLGILRFEVPGVEVSPVR